MFWWTLYAFFEKVFMLKTWTILSSTHGERIQSIYDSESHTSGVKLSMLLWFSKKKTFTKRQISTRRLYLYTLGLIEIEKFTSKIVELVHENKVINEDTIRPAKKFWGIILLRGMDRKSVSNPPFCHTKPPQKKIRIKINNFFQFV